MNRHSDQPAIRLAQYCHSARCQSIIYVPVAKLLKLT
jgi:hypothetical protein